VAKVLGHMHNFSECNCTVLVNVLN